MPDDSSGGGGGGLWDALAKIGLTYLPRFERLSMHNAVVDAKAEVAGALVKAAAERDIEAARRGELELTPDGRPRYLERTMRRVAESMGATSAEAVAESFAIAVVDNARKLDNVAAAVEAAQEDLSKRPPPVDTPSPGPDVDWMLRWRDLAGNVSRLELQQLWGRILAGEVRSPGAFSLRTLDFLRNASPDEAGLIHRLAPFMYDSFAWIPRDGGERAPKRLGDLGFAELLQLEDMGLIRGADGLGLINKVKPVQRQLLVSIGPTAFLADAKQPDAAFEFPVLTLTRLGAQVLSLETVKKDVGHLRRFLEAANSAGLDLCIGAVVKRAGNQTTVAGEFPFDPATFDWDQLDLAKGAANQA